MTQLLSTVIEKHTGQTPALCYHCHKCTAGCPVIGEMTYGPDQILRMIALDQKDLVLTSRDIWLCAGCYTCATRCPNGIDIAAVMDTLRQIAIVEKVAVPEKDVLLFHRLFLGVVSWLGRSHEAFVLGLFKIRSHIPILQDMGAGLELFRKGKVPLFPERIKDLAGIRQLFQESSTHATLE